MGNTAINANGLTKRYRTGADTWIDAVHDVSFQIEAGEAVGLIGRNGAGKSTLLKLLSRVTRPTAGYADIAGRIGALLEVGTGFHPDLSGRENAYLSGAILGLSRADVRARFDEMVAFAEIEQFIDMPVKRYSSGMYARLGFAVAAHLRPEILIVDEVLAVGDLPFQAKCLALMHNLTTEGTTVLFVSHNLLAVADLCSRGLVMSEGRIAHDGAVADAIATYRRTISAGTGPEAATSERGLSVLVNGRSGASGVDANSNETLHVDVTVDRPQASEALRVILNVVIETGDGRTVMHLRSDRSGEDLRVSPGRTDVSVTIDRLPLAAGTYWLWLRVVGLEPREPIMLDSERMPLTVLGDASTGAIVAPEHRFEVRSVPALTAAAE